MDKVAAPFCATSACVSVAFLSCSRAVPLFSLLAFVTKKLALLTWEGLLAEKGGPT